jgi:short-subunit dehydrogenase
MNGRNVVLTGASHGIGTYIAHALARQGANLLLVARSEPELAQLTEELRANGARVDWTVVDLAAPGAAEEIAGAAAAFGGADILVNNAALELQRRFHTLDIDDIESVIQVDLVAPIALTRLLLPDMLARGYGHVVNIASIAGHVGFPFTEAYAASKDGLIAFSRVLRTDYRAQGVSASAVVLGAVKDAGIGQRTIDELGLKTSTSFMASPGQVAKAIVRAIEKDKGELVVMPGPGRLLKALMDLFPALGPVMLRMSGGAKVMEQVADHRERSRQASLVR